MKLLDGNTDSMNMILALDAGDGQESLLCCSLWGNKELDMNEQLDGTSNFTFSLSRAIRNALEICNTKRKL